MSGRSVAGAGTLALQLRLADAARGGRASGYGSDWPVAPMDPSLGFWYGLARQPWQPGDPVQRLALEELIDGYTRDAAYAEFQEQQKGMVRVGMLADLVLLNADLFATPEDGHRPGEAAADDGGWPGGVPGDLATPRRSDAANRIVE
jgi:predicted amidohydrolase YtcJ